MGAIPSTKPFEANSAHIFPKATKSTSPSSSSAPKRNDLPFPMMKKRCKRAARGVITISTPHRRRRWDERWNCDYNLSLQDLHLQDLSDEHTDNAQLSITLSIQKHTGFGLSVDGRVITSIPRKCRNCSKPYFKEIDANFNAWVLPSGQESSHELPLIGLDDPSVIYVKPGNEVNLDSLVQDTVRVATSVNETCSESCEKSEPKLQQAWGKPNAASIDRRWSRLLELKQSGSRKTCTFNN